MDVSVSYTYWSKILWSSLQIGNLMWCRKTSKMSCEQTERREREIHGYLVLFFFFFFQSPFWCYNTSFPVSLFHLLCVSLSKFRLVASCFSLVMFSLTFLSLSFSLGSLGVFLQEDFLMHRWKHKIKKNPLAVFLCLLPKLQVFLLYFPCWNFWCWMHVSLVSVLSFLPFCFKCGWKLKITL